MDNSDNTCHLFLQCFILAFNIVELVKLIIIHMHYWLKFNPKCDNGNFYNVNLFTGEIKIL